MRSTAAAAAAAAAAAKDDGNTLDVPIPCYFDIFSNTVLRNHKSHKGRAGLFWGKKHLNKYNVRYLVAI